MGHRRIDRLNSLLREVIAEVIHNEVRNPKVHRLTSVTRVEITRDLHYAKVYVSVLGTHTEQENTVKALQSAAGFISKNSSQRVVMRYFPSLTFKLDDSVEQVIHMEELIDGIQAERRAREDTHVDGDRGPSSS